MIQREGCDADVNHFMEKYHLSGGGGSCIVDDMSAIALVMGGYGVCLVPELVIRNIPFPVDVYPLDVEEKNHRTGHRTFGCVCTGCPENVRLYRRTFSE